MEAYKTPSVLISEMDLLSLYNVVFNCTLVVLYCTLYRIHVKCGVLVEVSLNPVHSASPSTIRTSHGSIERDFEYPMPTMTSRIPAVSPGD